MTMVVSPLLLAPLVKGCEQEAGPPGCIPGCAPPWGAAMTDSPDLVAAKRLLDAAKDRGFAFERIAPGEDGRVLGVRETFQWRDTIYLGGFGQACTATRARKSSLTVSGGLPVAERVSGDALTVLHTVLCRTGLGHGAASRRGADRARRSCQRPPRRATPGR
jgi:hypothetical protein